jgi:hypothetical protein
MEERPSPGTFFADTAIHLAGFVQELVRYHPEPLLIHINVR